MLDLRSDSCVHIYYLHVLLGVRQRLGVANATERHWGRRIYHEPRTAYLKAQGDTNSEIEEKTTKASLSLLPPSPPE